MAGYSNRLLLSRTHCVKNDSLCMKDICIFGILTTQISFKKWQAHLNTRRLCMQEMQEGGVPHHAQPHAATPGGVKPAELQPHH